MPSGTLRSRLDVFAQLGIGTLRTGLGWRTAEPNPGSRRSLTDLAWIDAAQRGGFGFKTMIGSLSAAPEWFLAEHPDAALRNQHGETVPGLLSPWWPWLQDLLAEKAELAFSAAAAHGMLRARDACILDLGRAGEPIYPGKPANSFWFYDPHARTAFVAFVREKYGHDPERAAQAWKLPIVPWSNLDIPAPGTHPGPLWRDVLLWYRDSKRSLIENQIRLYRTLLNRYGDGPQTGLILLVPGQHLPEPAFDAAVATGDWASPLEVMVDTEFLLTTACHTGCWVQSTGCEVASEDNFIAMKLRQLGCKTNVWGENAGGRPADDPAELARAIIQGEFNGFEYIDSSHIVEPDGRPRQPTFDAFRNCCRTLLAAWAHA